MASERGAGQTGRLRFTGVRTQNGIAELSRMAWESQPEMVRVQYAKSEVNHEYPEYRRTRETRWEYGGTTLQA